LLDLGKTKQYYSNINKNSKEIFVHCWIWFARICKSKDRQNNGQKKKDKQRSTKHYTEN